MADTRKAYRRTRPGTRVLDDMALSRQEFGQRFRTARERAHLTQEQVADALGVNWRQIQRYDSGASVPRASRIPQLAGILGVEPTYLEEPQTQPLMERLEAKADEQARGVRTIAALLDDVVGKLDALTAALAAHDSATVERIATVNHRLEAIETRVEDSETELTRFQEEFVQALGGDDRPPPATQPSPSRNSGSKKNRAARREAG
jgi:transcriptional regulator with XRE-family HTH domain